MNQTFCSKAVSEQFNSRGYFSDLSYPRPAQFTYPQLTMTFDTGAEILLGNEPAYPTNSVLCNYKHILKIIDSKAFFYHEE